MKKFFNVLRKSAMFKNIDENDFEAALSLANIRVASYKKNEIICDYNEKTTETGIILDGTCQITKIDVDGNRAILRSLNAGKSFGDTLVLSGLKKAPIVVIATANCMVALISIKKVIEKTPSSRDFRTTMIENIIELLAQKSVALLVKNDILTKKTIRKKLLAFFEYYSAIQDSKSIPFSQEELADYLSVNRSALTRELLQMRKEGILSYEKNIFTINYKLFENEFQ